MYSHIFVKNHLPTNKLFNVNKKKFTNSPYIWGGSSTLATRSYLTVKWDSDLLRLSLCRTKNSDEDKWVRFRSSPALFSETVCRHTQDTKQFEKLLNTTLQTLVLIFYLSFLSALIGNPLSRIIGIWFGGHHVIDPDEAPQTNNLALPSLSSLSIFAVMMTGLTLSHDDCEWVRCARTRVMLSDAACVRSYFTIIKYNLWRILMK